MNPIPRVVTALVAAGLLGTVLVGCGSGTDRAVPGPTTPPRATTADGTTDGATDGVASAEPALATTGATPAATDGATVDAAATPAATGSSGAPGAGGASATATVGLVAGFPSGVLPLLPGATVTASAVRASGDRLELSLSATTSRTVEQVLTFYDKALRGKGFTTAGGSPTIAPGTGGRIYARGDEVVVLAVTRTGGGVSFSVGGTVRA